MLQEIEKQSGKKVFSILQLRLHPVIKEMKKSLNSTTKKTFCGAKLYNTKG
jgi:predicted dehydrogenase